MSCDLITKEKIASRFALQGQTVSFDIDAAPAEGVTIDPQLIWTTYYGSTQASTPSSLTTDAAGNAYMAGRTLSTTNIVTSGAHQTALSGTGTDAFLVKFTSAGARLWGTYYGGTSNDEFTAIACAPNGDVLAAGVTNSSTFIATSGSHQPALSAASATEGFLVRFNPSGVRQWATYYGGRAPMT